MAAARCAAQGRSKRERPLTNGAGVGPVLSYAAKLGKHAFAAEVKWLPQIGTEHTLKGDYVWFKLGIQF